MIATTGRSQDAVAAIVGPSIRHVMNDSEGTALAPGSETAASSAKEDFMMSEARPSLLADPEEAEHRALAAAVAEARADPRPDVPHEKVRAEMLREMEELSTLPKVSPPA